MNTSAIKPEEYYSPSGIHKRTGLTISDVLNRLHGRAWPISTDKVVELKLDPSRHWYRGSDVVKAFEKWESQYEIKATDLVFRLEFAPSIDYPKHPFRLRIPSRNHPGACRRLSRADVARLAATAMGAMAAEQAGANDSGEIPAFPEVSPIPEPTVYPATRVEIPAPDVVTVLPMLRIARPEGESDGRGELPEVEAVGERSMIEVGWKPGSD